MSDIFSNFTIFDIFDISIIAIIVYQVMLLIQGTKSLPLIKGIIFILIVFIISQILHLNTLIWILSNTFAVGILAIFILFQPEIRGALFKLGRKNIFSFSKKPSYEIINLLSEFCVKSSKKRLGALIVLERDDKLNNIIQTGILLDAKLSSELLLTIFNTATLLHDGAVIIRGDRIVAAGCILPLTDRQDLDLKYGTRHRAALGLSETTDAIILIVSEESQEISIVCSSELFSGLTMETLKDKINELYKQAYLQRINNN